MAGTGIKTGPTREHVIGLYVSVAIHALLLLPVGADFFLNGQVPVPQLTPPVLLNIVFVPEGSKGEKPMESNHPARLGAREPINTPPALSISTLATVPQSPPKKTDSEPQRLALPTPLADVSPVPVSLPGAEEKVTSQGTALSFPPTAADRAKEWRSQSPSNSGAEVTALSIPSALPPETGPGAPSYGAPKYRKTTQPNYPASARRQGHQGIVILRLRVNSHGRTDKVELKSSSSYASLDAAAIKAARDWEFEPAKVNQRPVSCEVEVPVHFQLADQRGLN